jgi:hypothetical protein
MAEPEVEEAGEVATCSICEQVRELPDLAECYACRKVYCAFCAFRIGGQGYCSRSCGTRYFFGGDEDDEVLED